MLFELRSVEDYTILHRQFFGGIPARECRFVGNPVRRDERAASEKVFVYVRDVGLING